MKKLITALIVSSVLAGTAVANETAFEPSEAQLHAYKAYHHGRYLVVTARKCWWYKQTYPYHFFTNRRY